MVVENRDAHACRRAASCRDAWPAASRTPEPSPRESRGLPKNRSSPAPRPTACSFPTARTQPLLPPAETDSALAPRSTRRCEVSPTSILRTTLHTMPYPTDITQYLKINQHQLQTAEVLQQLIPHLHELSRSKPYKEISSKTEPLTKALIESSQEEWNTLESVTSRILDVSEVIPLTTDILQSAIRNEEALGLEPPDATVYASIFDDLQVRGVGSKCFLNKNSKDFANPDIYDALRLHECILIPSFENGVKFVSKRISDGGSS